MVQLVSPRKEELKEVLTPLSQDEIRNLDRLNYTDFGFMIFYGLFLYFVLSKISKLEGSTLLKMAKWLAPIIVVCDFLETVQLLKLSNFETNSDLNMVSILQALGLFTWAKWLLLSVAFAILGLEMLRTRMKYSWIGIPLVLPVVLGIYAFLTTGAKNEDLFATSIFGAFFLVFVYCFIYKE